jgi:hypothetical protein
MRNTSNKKWFAFGALFVTGFASMSFLVGVTIIDNIEEGDPIWIRGTSKLIESRANETATAESQANTTERGSPLPVIERRFPTYGTMPFSRQCLWTEQKADKNLDCVPGTTITKRR